MASGPFVRPGSVAMTWHDSVCFSQGMRVITVAAKDTGGQERASKQSEEVDEEFVDETSDLKERHAKLSEDVDDVLDEIDEVLETDAESFVRSFVQKGGQ